MAILDDTREFLPARAFREDDPTSLYWVRGDTVVYRNYPLKGADIESFRFYLGSFGKDRSHCYCTNVRLAGANGATCRALNFTYATDGVFVWTIAGKIKDVDAESFVVCDDGSLSLGSGLRVPHGFGKDKSRVYYYDYDGKPNWVRKASSASFLSLNDSYFGKDEHYVFYGAATLPKATVECWRKIGGHYSKDDERIYYLNRLIRGADYETFEVVNTGGFLQMAKDRNCFYETDRVVGETEFLEQIEKYGKTN